MNNSANAQLLTIVIGDLMATAKELCKIYPEGTAVDFMDRKGEKVLASGTIALWDWDNWKCVLDSGKSYRFNDLRFTTQMRPRQ